MKVAAVALALAASAHAKVFFEEKFEKFDTKTWCVGPEEGLGVAFLSHSLTALLSRPQGRIRVEVRRHGDLDTHIR